MLDHILQFRQENPELKLGIEHNIGVELYRFIKEKNLKVVVETGIAYGFSSWYILEALAETNGILHSIESKFNCRTVVPDRLKKHWLCYEMVSPQYLYLLLQDLKNQDNQIDLFWHDSDHSFGIQFGEYTFAHAFNVTYIGSHDICRSGAWEAFLILYNYKELISGYKYAIACRTGVL